jgi:hypothetical protein
LSKATAGKQGAAREGEMDAAKGKKGAENEKKMFF